MSLREQGARQVAGLRAAAAQLGGPVNTLEEVTIPTWPLTDPKVGGTARTRRAMTVPGEVARSLAALLVVAADRIDQVGHSLGLPVSYELRVAGAILGQDLGHNR